MLRRLRALRGKLSFFERRALRVRLPRRSATNVTPVATPLRRYLTDYNVLTPRDSEGTV